MYKSTKENHGNYNLFTYLQRGVELCSIKEFCRFRRKYRPNLSFIGSCIMLVDYYICLIRYGATVCDYFEYQFWKKKHCERKEYVTMLFSRAIQKRYNHGDKEVFIDKLKFNKVYSDFRTTKSMDMNRGGYDSFVEFVKSCNGKILMKPLMGASGVGIYKPNVSSDEKIATLYKEIINSGEDYLAEQLFKQTGILHDVNPSAVNTVRIFTLNDGENVYLMCAGLRIGSGKSIVDNIHSGGCVCELDKETGTVIGPGYNLLGERFVRHPVTKVMIPGIKVPLWNKVLQNVKKAALVSPHLGHCAWDVAVSEAEISLIEANEQGNFDLIQCCSQRGFKKDYVLAMKGKTAGLFKL